MSNVGFMTFLLGMVPIIELRGAIPFGVAGGLSVSVAILLAVLGNLLPIPFILLFIRKIFSYMRSEKSKLGAIVDRMEKKVDKNRKVIDRYAWWGLVILVAIPLPGTGAWTGALVAAMLEMRIIRALPAIALGVIIAGVIVASLTFGIAGLFS